jgi:hypothetical protein
MTLEIGDGGGVVRAGTEVGTGVTVVDGVATGVELAVGVTTGVEVAVGVTTGVT